MEHDSTTFSWLEPKARISFHGFLRFASQYCGVPILFMKMLIVYGAPVALVLVGTISIGLWFAGMFDLGLIYRMLLICAYAALVSCVFFGLFWLLLPVAYIGDHFQNVRIDVTNIGIIASGRYKYNIIRHVSVGTDEYGVHVLSFEVRRAGATKSFTVSRRIAADVDTQRLVEFVRSRVNDDSVSQFIGL